MMDGDKIHIGRVRKRMSSLKSKKLIIKQKNYMHCEEYLKMSWNDAL